MLSIPLSPQAKFPQVGDLAALAFLTGLWWVFLGYSGSWGSGYHFFGDHFMLTEPLEIAAQGKGFWETTAQWIGLDAGTRFRPLFWVNRVAEIFIFGDEVQAVAMYHGVLAILTSWLLYLFCRLERFNPLLAVMMPLLVLLGLQSETWRSLDYQEPLGILFLAGAMCALPLSVRAKHNRGLWAVLLGLAVLLMSLCKESFILVIPALVFWRVWMTREHLSVGWGWALRSNRLMLAFLLGLTLLEVAAITFYLGGHSQESHDYRLPDLVRDLSVAGGLKLVAIALVLMVLHGAIRQKSLRLQDLSFLKDFLPVMLLTALWVLPQLVLHYRTGVGLAARYLLPSLVGTAYLFLWTCRYGRRHFSPLHLAVFVFMLSMVWPAARLTYQRSQEWAWQGQAIREISRDLAAAAPQGPVLVVANSRGHGEMSSSYQIYLNHRKGLPPGSIWLYINPAQQAHQSDMDLMILGHMAKVFGPRLVESPGQVNDLGAVVMLPAAEPLFKSGQGQWLQKTGFSRREYNYDGDRKMVLYSR